MKDYVLDSESEIECICATCHSTGSFTVSVTFMSVHLLCKECESLYTLNTCSLLKDPYKDIDDSGLLIDIKKTG